MEEESSRHALYRFGAHDPPTLNAAALDSDIPGLSLLCRLHVGQVVRSGRLVEPNVPFLATESISPFVTPRESIAVVDDCARPATVPRHQFGLGELFHLHAGARSTRPPSATRRHARRS